MNEELVNLLSTFGYPVIQQGSMGEDEAYPDSLFTFYNIDTPDDGFYDNNPTRSIWTYYIYFYSNDPLLVNTKLREVTDLLRKNKWIVNQRNGYDIESDVDTHSGRYTTVYYIKED